MAKETASGSVGQEIGGKLSVADFGWTKPNIQAAVLADRTKRVFLMRAIGVVTALKPYKDKESGETRYGSQGDFEIISGAGEVKKGTVLYLPSYVQGLIEGVMATQDAAAIRIAFDIYAEYNEKSATSYSFVAFDLLNEGSEGVDSVKSAVASLALPGGPAPAQLEAPKE